MRFNPGKMMIFASDNWAGAHPRISASLSANADGYASAYGSSDLDQAVKERFSVLFEREVAVFFVVTGTAANSLSMTLVSRPGGVAFAHREAHMLQDECGAPEYLSGGGRLHPVDGVLGKVDPARLERAIGQFDPDFLHGGRPMAVSLTQATEIGTIYQLDEIAAISAIARRHGVPLHMDGARFANALVALDTTPAEMTWKRGVDLVSFGGTKNGCWCAEAIVLFDLAKARELAFVHKRAAQLFSKSRFVAAQFDAYFRDDLWLETARHANRMTARLAERIGAARSTRLAWKPEANELFAVMDKEIAEALQAKGAVFYPWAAPRAFEGQISEGESLYRFVTSFKTTEEEVDRFGELIG
jgi:threonine aldolase